MWAAIKSDLREFATGAAEETNVVAERVVGTRIIRTGGGNGGGNGEDDVANDDDNDASVIPGVAVLSSIGERGLRGLSSVTSIMGGIVAPPYHRTSAPGAVDGGGGVIRDHQRDGAPSSPPIPAAGASSLSSMLAAAVAYGDDDEEEDELGWDDDDDDDDDDLDVGDDEKEDGTAGSSVLDAMAVAVVDAKVGGGDVIPSTGDSTNTNMTKEDDDDRDTLIALKSKLESVERSRNELQNEHRRQTAELVELRSKVEELERERAGKVEGERGEEEEVIALRLQVEELKSRLNEQSKSLSKEQEELVERILLEKERLDAELIVHKRRNDELVEENRALLVRGGGDDDDDDDDGLLLREYQQRIRDLEDDLASAKADLYSASAKLITVKEDAEDREMANRMIIEERSMRKNELEGSVEVDDVKSKLAAVEGGVHADKAELGVRTSEYEGEPRVEAVSRSSSSPPVAAAVHSATDPAVSSDEAVLEDDDAVTPPPPPAPNGPSRASTRNNDSDALGEGVTSSPSSRGSGISPPIKFEVDDELSDDWGDGGWGDE